MAKALITVGLFFFYLHWCVVFLVSLVCNVFKLLWKSLSQATPEKHHLTPLETTHHHVFTHICKTRFTQTISFPTKVSLSKLSNFKRRIKPTSKCGGSSGRIKLPPSLTPSC